MRQEAMHPDAPVHIPTAALRPRNMGWPEEVSCSQAQGVDRRDGHHATLSRVSCSLVANSNASVVICAHSNTCIAHTKGPKTADKNGTLDCV
eukprot:scaffold112383_cov52-Prasinocladus_malaysianus.AAC.2